MSLNKFTDATTRKEYMNINCSDLKCEILNVDNAPWGDDLKVGEQPVLIGIAGGSFTVLTQSPAFYKIIGDQIEISGSFRGINSQAKAQLNIQFPSIDGKGFQIGKFLYTSANGVDFNGGFFYSDDASILAQDNITWDIYYQGTGATSEINYNFIAKYS